MAAVRVLVVDDSAPWRWVVSAILQHFSGCEIVGEAFDGAQAVQKSIELRPDVVLLDIGLPRLNGLEAARQIRSNLQDCKIVLICELMSTRPVRSAMGADIQGCLCKYELVNELLSTLDDILGASRLSTNSFATATPGPGTKHLFLANTDSSVN